MASIAEVPSTLLGARPSLCMTVTPTWVAPRVSEASLVKLSSEPRQALFSIVSCMH